MSLCQFAWLSQKREQGNLCGYARNSGCAGAATIACEPPAEGWLKINADGSFVPETEAASVDAVLRDHLGNALAATAKALNT